MARLQAKSVGSPDEVRTFPNGTLEIYSLDDVVIGRTLFQPGWHWATDVKPIAGTPSCQYHHLGVCIGGRLGILTLGDLHESIRARGRPNFVKIRLADHLPNAPGVYLASGR